MILVLSIALTITALFLFAAIIHIRVIQKELRELGREQHTQNMDIIRLLKYQQESSEMLLQHIDILKYLCDRDPLLGKLSVPYTGPIGEA